MFQEILALIIIFLFIARISWQLHQKLIPRNQFIFWLFFWVICGILIIYIKKIDALVANIGIIILSWGIEERKIFPGYKINLTILLGLLCILGGLIYQIYSKGIILGIFSWSIIIFFALIFKRFILARFL